MIEVSSEIPSKAKRDVTRCLVCKRQIDVGEYLDYVYNDTGELLGAIHSACYGRMFEDAAITTDSNGSRASLSLTGTAERVS